MKRYRAEKRGTDRLIGDLIALAVELGRRLHTGEDRDESSYADGFTDGVAKRSGLDPESIAAARRISAKLHSVE